MNNKNMTDKFFGLIKYDNSGKIYDDEPIKLFNTKEERDIVFNTFSSEYTYKKFETDRP